MKRRITELEQTLLKDGWYLVSKDYTGKHSEKTKRYEYIKTITYEDNFGFQGFIYLNDKRNKIVNIGVNVFNGKMTDETHHELYCQFDYLNDYVAKLVKKPQPIEEENTHRKLDDLELSAHEKYLIEKATGTTDIDKMTQMPNLLVKLLCNIKPKYIPNIVKILVENGVIENADN